MVIPSKASSVHDSPQYTANTSSAASPRSSVSSANDFDGDDVAIIGMACRAAGGIDSPDKLWQFLMDKKDGHGLSPSWRWDAWIKRDPRNAKIIAETHKKGYFIEDLENFDAAFFGISPKEAEQMDPHQRLGLETTWEALEHAGLNPHSLRKSDTAVYMGVDSDDYARLILEDLGGIQAHSGIGTTAHGIPNRISYHLDFMGPSVAVDSACASSLCAVHFGRQAIITGESRLAVVGGVNVALSPALFRMLGSAGALSPDGFCMSFDDAANGYARGEGAAVLILKRVSHAIADGDRILATLKGSAIAQDGKTNGIMAPNSKSQALVARKALEVAGVDPLTVGFVEAHATSTPLGDPTEVSAIAAVYGENREPSKPAYIGSIKPNIGHLEAAAGAISLIKAVMAVHQGEIPPQARLTKLNSKIAWEKSGLQVVRERTRWEESEGPRRAGICSYGYGGTVSHVVIEESPFLLPSNEVDKGEPVLLLLSAPQQKRLALQSAAQADWLSSAGKSESLKTIASTLGRRRAHHTFRAAVVVSDHEEAAEALASHAKGSQGDFVAEDRVMDGNKDVVWVFSGHGAQWTGMGKDLIKNQLFYHTLLPLDAIVQQELGWSAIEKFKTGDFQDSDEIQVLTYLIQVGLAELLKSKGLRPSAIIGHSVGELAASVAAGCITVEEGAIIVTRRAKLYAQVRGYGGMFLVNQAFAEISKDLEGRKDIIAAIHSSPTSCVISGASEPLRAYVETLKARGARAFEVKTDIPFHSPILDKLSTPLAEALSEQLTPRAPSVKLYSTSQSDARSQTLRDTDYWVNNMVNPVWLNNAVEAAAEDGYRVFLEVSSHPIVSHSVSETLSTKDLKEFAVISSMKKNQPAEKSVLHAIGQLHVRGAEIDFTALYGRSWSKHVPGFVWSKKPFWKEVTTATFDADSRHGPEQHHVLGQRAVIAGTDTTLYTSKLEESNKPFPQPHMLHDTNIIPAAVYVNTFLQATGAKVLSDIAMTTPLAVTEQLRSVQVIANGQDVKVASRLESTDEQSWTIHSAARYSKDSPPAITSNIDIAAIQKRIGTLLPNNFSMDHLTKVGVTGLAFPWAVTQHYGNATEMIAKIDADPHNEKITWDPSSWAAVLDAASSVGATVFFGDAKLRIVSKIRQAIIHSDDTPPKICFLHVTQGENPADDPSSRAADVSVLDLHGKVLAQFLGLTLTEVDGSSRKSQGMTDLVHQMAWAPARLTEKPLDAEQVVLVSEHSGILDRYEKDLEGQPFDIIKISSCHELEDDDLLSQMTGKSSAVVYCPGPAQSDDIFNNSQRLIWETIAGVKAIYQNKLSAKFFVVTNRVFAGESDTALTQGALYGTARIAAVEHSDIWGGLIDVDGPAFPALPIKYVSGRDVIRYIDGVPKVARWRPFTKDHLLPTLANSTLLPKPEGTYIITGGLGFLGLETADFLIAKGARRIVLISRRALPPRSQWTSAPPSLSATLARIQAMESHGASIYSMALDMGADDAHTQILSYLERMALPPVLGVIHGAGLLEGAMMMDIQPDMMTRVLSPKISGALALHRAFPVSAPNKLDFFILFSSIGQLVGTAGQSAYAPSNAFLDTLAIHRRAQGDNAIAFQWTAWRGTGMGQSDHLDLELKAAGITDITVEEGFKAWEHMSKYDTDHCVVTRTTVLEADEPIPCALLEDIAVRARPAASSSSTSEAASESKSSATERPTSEPELKTWLSIKVRECLGSALKISEIEDIDERVAVADLGVDSVMTLVLCQKLQSVLKIKVPQTLVWNYPTVGAMVEWFAKQF